MTHIDKKVTFDADDCYYDGITRCGTSGFKLNLVGNKVGPKNTTIHTMAFYLSFCELRAMCQDAHVVMDELMDQWQEAKKVMNGSKARYRPS